MTQVALNNSSLGVVRISECKRLLELQKLLEIQCGKLAKGC